MSNFFTEFPCPELNCLLAELSLLNVLYLEALDWLLLDSLWNFPLEFSEPSILLFYVTTYIALSRNLQS